MERRPPVLATQLSLLDTQGKGEMLNNSTLTSKGKASEGSVTVTPPKTPGEVKHATVAPLTSQDKEVSATVAPTKTTREVSTLGISEPQETDSQESSHSQDKPNCPHCGSSKVKSNGNRKRKDGSLVTGPDGQLIKRFKCLECGKGF